MKKWALLACLCIEVSLLAMLQNGTNPNQQDLLGWTSLFHFFLSDIATNRKDTLLLPEQKNELDLYASIGNDRKRDGTEEVEQVKSLLQLGAHLDIRDVFGCRIMYYAKKFKNQYPNISETILAQHEKEKNEKKCKQ